MVLNIGIIGSGNVATHLAKEFIKIGHQIQFIYSKNEANATNLAQKVTSKVVSSLDFSSYSKLDIILIAIKDDAIKDVLTQIITSKKTIIAHTSGSISMSIFRNFENAGIFYPLQTFTKNRNLDFSEIPILIESKNENSLKLLFELGKSISNNVQIADSEKRKIIHLAAVFTNNFTNAMLTISQEILEANQIDKDILYPLAKETIAKAHDLGAKNAQTGPAKRGDLEVQRQQLELLDDELLKEIYKLISNIIHEKN